MNGSVEHKLHEVVADCIRKCGLSNCEILFDPACDGGQNIPLFKTEDKSRATRYSVVDILIIKNEKVKVIIEIEESDVTPIRICGKFLASALSKFYIHETKGNKKIKMDKSITFIQICSTKGLSDSSSKQEQWDNLEDSITGNISTTGKMKWKYRLIYGEAEDYKSYKCDELIEIIKEALNR
ncbi:hypothetical protein ES703_65755 [subsurface metagenome]